MLQENDLYPGGVSGHETAQLHPEDVPLCRLRPRFGKYPMQDSIDVYPSDAMIALPARRASVPISSITALHESYLACDARRCRRRLSRRGAGLPGVQAVGHFPHRRAVSFHIGATRAVVKSITPGLIASLWKRPGKAGSAIIAIMNYGPNPDGSEPVRAGKLHPEPEGVGRARGRHQDRR